MIRYETLVLASPEITADETSQLETSFERILNDHKASLISFERWGKYRLAYPVAGNDYGVYFLARFEVIDHVQELLNEVQTLMKVKLNEIVMRYVTCRLDSRAPLAYNRPESLEEIPTRDVESFIKETKATGLLNKRSRHAADASVEKGGHETPEEVNHDDETEEGA
jgi:ribosomal protein S6